MALLSEAIQKQRQGLSRNMAAEKLAFSQVLFLMGSPVGGRMIIVWVFELTVVSGPDGFQTEDTGSKEMKDSQIKPHILKYNYMGQKLTVYGYANQDGCFLALCTSPGHPAPLLSHDDAILFNYRT